jgi:hypothetical protein
LDETLAEERAADKLLSGIAKSVYDDGPLWRRSLIVGLIIYCPMC